MATREDFILFGKRCREDSRYFAAKTSFIDNKDAVTVPFILNFAQEIVLEKIIEEFLIYGNVDILILKARQLGISMFVLILMLQKAMLNYNIKAKLISHDQRSTNAMFSNLKYFYDNNLLKDEFPAVKSNAKELTFRHNSSIHIGTAGARQSGRGEKLQFLHFSEIAFYKESYINEIRKAMLPTLSRNSLLIMESTANGSNNYFYRECQRALAGESRKSIIFISWIKEPYYEVENFDEKEFNFINYGNDIPSVDDYMDMYGDQGMTLAKLAWRQNIIENHYSGNPYEFLQEYPSNPDEAFTVSDTDSFISLKDIMNTDDTIPPPKENDYKVMGIDVGRFKDKTTIYIRTGRQLMFIEELENMELYDQTEKIAIIANKYKVDLINIDKGSFGLAIYEDLRRKRFNVNGVDFGGEADEKTRYYNKTAEMFGRSKEWFREGYSYNYLENGKNYIPLLKEQLSSRKYMYEDTKHTRLRMFSKQKYKEEHNGKSPDHADAFILTFAKVNSNYQAQKDKRDYNADRPYYSSPHRKLW